MAISNIKVIANSKTLDHLHNLLDQVEEKERIGDSLLAIINTFYDSVEMQDGGVKRTWMMDNTSTKWIQMNDIIDDGKFSVESQGYPPGKFFRQLYNILIPYDENMKIEVEYYDSDYGIIGSYLMKCCDGDHQFWHESETTDVENLINSDSWDEIYDQQKLLLKKCYSIIESDGEPISEID